MDAAILVQPSAPAPSASPSRRFRPDGWRWGFVGVHGGFALALSVAAMKHRARGQVLRHVSAEFSHPLRNDFVIEVSEDVVLGDNASWLSARVTVNGFEAVVADALFAETGDAVAAQVEPPMPPCPRPADCTVLTIPTAFAPFVPRTEIRSVGGARPFNGTAEPEFVAWVRLVDGDLPPDEVRLIALMDSLAPSLGAARSRVDRMTIEMDQRGST